MWIAMTLEMSGSRNDDRWPSQGVPFQVPDEEGAHLIQVGQAVPVQPPASADPVLVLVTEPARPMVSEPAMTAAGPVPEPPTQQSMDEPKPAAPKQDWVDYAMSFGAGEDEANMATKAELMQKYGGRL